MVLTSRSVSELGRRFRVDLLILQARATLNAVAEDPLVSKALGASFIAQMKEKVERLEASFKDRLFAEDRSRNGTLVQNVAVREANAWRRDFTEMVKSALRYGADVPADGGKMGKQRKPVQLAVEVDRLVEYGESFAAKLAEFDVVIPPDTLSRGRDLAESLRTADAMQEHLRFTGRVGAVQEMRRQAVAVLNAVRDVNGKARAVYHRDLKKARPFSMRILARKATPPSFADPPIPAIDGKASKGKPGESPSPPDLPGKLPEPGKEAASA